MFVLEPIDSRIQKKLQQKQNWMQRISAEETSHIETGDIAPGEWNMPIEWESPENISQIFTRSTWVRMSAASGYNMISVVGGELSTEKESRWGGPTASDSDDSSLLYRNKVQMISRAGIDDEYKEYEAGRSAGWRPVAGIKSINSEYQNYSVRNTTVNWIAWDFETIEDLTPFFLSNGSVVLVEWGWSTQENLNLKIFTPDNINDAYSKLKTRILENKGDYDAIVGQIKNFQWKTRDDGGFDCTTEIVSMGINILEQSYPGSTNTKTGDRNQQVVFTEKDGGSVPSEITEIREAKVETFFEDLEHQLTYMFFEGYDSNYFNKNFSCGVLFKTNGADDVASWKIRYDRNPKNSDSVKGIIGPYVTWGWMEDNILNRFFGFFDSKSGESKLEIRSIVPVKETIHHDDGTTTSNPVTDEEGNVIYESTKCLNSKHLYTSNINKFILKGQPSAYTLNEDATKDNSIIYHLTNFLNNKGYEGEWKKNITRDIPRFKEFAVDDEKSAGYIRNIILHWEVIKEAFLGAGSLKNGLFNLFSILNSESGGIWNFELVTDSENPQRMVVIDGNYSVGEFIPAVGSHGNRDLSRSTNENYEYDGLYIFPLFSNASIVKSQNIETNITSEMGTMMILSKYGNPSNTYENIIKIKDGQLQADLIGKLFNPKYIASARPFSIDIVSQHLRDYTNPFLDEITPAKTAGLGSAIGNVDGDENSKIMKFLPGNTHYPAFKYDALRARDKTFEKVGEYIRAKILTQSQLETEGAKPYQDVIQNLMSTMGFNRETIPTIDFSVIKFPEEPLMSGTPTKDTTAVYDGNGIMYDKWKTIMVDKIMSNADGIINDIDPVVPLEISLEIDGTGGIFPGNSFHTNYLPTRYKKATCFQCIGVEHSLDSSGWTTTIKGIMTIFMEVLKEEYGYLHKDEDAQKMTAEQINEILRTMEEIQTKFKELVPTKEITIRCQNERSFDLQHDYWPHLLNGKEDFVGDEMLSELDGKKWNYELNGNFGTEGKASGLGWHGTYWTAQDNLYEDIKIWGLTKKDMTAPVEFPKHYAGSSINQALHRVMFTIKRGVNDWYAKGGEPQLLPHSVEIYDDDGKSTFATVAVMHDLLWLAHKHDVWLQIYYIAGDDSVASTRSASVGGGLINPLMKGNYLYFRGEKTGDILGGYTTGTTKKLLELLQLTPAERKNIMFKLEVGPFMRDESGHVQGIHQGSEIGSGTTWNAEVSSYPKIIDPASVGGAIMLDGSGQSINYQDTLEKIQDIKGRGPLPPAREWVNPEPGSPLEVKTYVGVPSPQEYIDNTILPRVMSKEPAGNYPTSVRYCHPLNGGGHTHKDSQLREQTKTLYEKWITLEDDKTTSEKWTIKVRT